jgi:glycosyltransferase involved in cell wall biosynthesis
MVDKKKIIHVPDGIDGVFTVETNKVIEIKKRLKIKEDKKIIVYLGTLNRLEGTDILLEVARRILLCRKDLIFMIMGYPNVEFYKNKAKQLGIQENVIFTGKINYDEALNYLSLGTLAISPKISETEGNGKLLLYMLAGLPAVVFDTWANRETLGPYGIYCQFGSVDDMVEKLNKHIDTGQNIKFEMKTKLTERVKTKFNWDDIVRKIIYSYELAASKPKG